MDDQDDTPFAEGQARLKVPNSRHMRDLTRLLHYRQRQPEKETYDWRKPFTKAVFFTPVLLRH